MSGGAGGATGAGRAAVRRVVVAAALVALGPPASTAAPPAATLPGRADPALTATVLGCRPLRYHHGPVPSLDLPGHVRAGSGLRWAGDRLAVIQDDTAALALVAPGAMDAPGPPRVSALPLPAIRGRRRFSKARGNKAFKPDFEALVADGDTLWALGSGSTPARYRVARVPRARRAALGRRVEVIDATAFYRRLLASPDFAGAELNLEGAARLGDRLALLQRGNGAPRPGRPAVDAVGLVDWAAWRRWVRDPAGPAPGLAAVYRYDLGTLAGTRLTFTDGVARGGALLFLAAAEASPDTYRDGPVRGSAIGVLTPGGPARWAPLRDRTGAVFAAKAEGVALDPHDPNRAFLTLDVDDPDRPCELCEVRLGGFGRSGAAP